MAIESLFTNLLRIRISGFFTGISMIGQPVMKNNGGRYAECKYNQQCCGYNFFYYLVFKQSLFFATMLQIYTFCVKRPNG